MFDDNTKATEMNNFTESITCTGLHKIFVFFDSLK